MLTLKGKARTGKKKMFRSLIGEATNTKRTVTVKAMVGTMISKVRECHSYLSKESETSPVMY